MTESQNILEVNNLRAHFHTRRGIVKAVDGVTFNLKRGETLGIVGESGSGKTVTHLAFLGLLPQPPLRIAGGEVIFQGRDLLTADSSTLREIRGNKIAMIFQEPMTSLNPYLKIGNQLIEPFLAHRRCSKTQAWSQATEALKRVGMVDAESAMGRYPHEFSGGMRQRVMIAMALTTRPDILIADEPTTALDVTVQAQILDLLKELQQETGMSIILITHDLGIVAGITDRVVVLYAGKVFEDAPTDDIFRDPQHPYSYALLKSIPRLDVDQTRLPVIGGTPPDLINLETGCPFYERCDLRLGVCRDVFPAARLISPQHTSFCHFEGSLK